MLTGKDENLSLTLKTPQTLQPLQTEVVPIFCLSYFLPALITP